MKTLNRLVARAALASAVLAGPAAVLIAQHVHAADTKPAETKPTSRPAAAENNKDWAAAEALVSKALDYLKTQQQKNFGWQTGQEPPALTAIVLKAYVQDPHYDPEQPFIDKSYDFLVAFQKPDGSISDDSLFNYNTAIAISALAAARDAEYVEPMNKAVAYLRSIQWTDKIQGVEKRNKQVDEKDPNYGGFGYGGKGRADNSNAQIALDALKDAGLKSDDPAFQAALKFVTRDQNNSETNDQKWAGDDGGFVYTPAEGGQSPAGEFTSPDGRRMLRSYGSMTYAGLKSMMYAGLTKEDPRVKAAWKWITSSWTLDENPGMQVSGASNAENGLFYYYHTLARALHAYGEPVITDTKGVKHDWRLELIAKLQNIQKPDGSWEGKQKWMENKPVLSTAYGVLALQEAQADLVEHPAK